LGFATEGLPGAGGMWHTIVNRQHNNINSLRALTDLTAHHKNDQEKSSLWWLVHCAVKNLPMGQIRNIAIYERQN
jgi:hypothetical protein